MLQAGCASLPTDVQRPPSFAIMPSDDTSLGRIATASSPDLDLTGFRLLPTGEFALDTRLVLGLAAHPNVEVRLFNPFPAGRARLTTRFLASLFDFNRINRRMHNKLMVFDGAMAIVGGRNIADEYIADEYFMRHEASNFVDLDAFVVGALLPELSQMFDDDWNSPVVFPLHALVPQVQSAERLRADFERRTNSATTSPPPAVPASATDVLGYGPISEELAFGRLGLIWAFATAYADPPGRIKGMGAHYRS